MFAIDHAGKTDLRSFLAGLPADDEANEVIVPARFDPLTIRRDAATHSRRITALLTASLPGARRTRR